MEGNHSSAPLPIHLDSVTVQQSKELHPQVSGGYSFPELKT